MAPPAPIPMHSVSTSPRAPASPVASRVHVTSPSKQQLLSRLGQPVLQQPGSPLGTNRRLFSANVGISNMPDFGLTDSDQTGDGEDDDEDEEEEEEEAAEHQKRQQVTLTQLQALQSLFSNFFDPARSAPLGPNSERVRLRSVSAEKRRTATATSPHRSHSISKAVPLSRARTPVSTPPTTTAAAPLRRTPSASSLALKTVPHHAVSASPRRARSTSSAPTPAPAPRSRKTFNATETRTAAPKSAMSASKVPSHGRGKTRPQPSPTDRHTSRSAVLPASVAGDDQLMREQVLRVMHSMHQPSASPTSRATLAALLASSSTPTTASASASGAWCRSAAVCAGVWSLIRRVGFFSLARTCLKLSVMTRPFVCCVRSFNLLRLRQCQLCWSRRVSLRPPPNCARSFRLLSLCRLRPNTSWMRAQPSCHPR